MSSAPSVAPPLTRIASVYARTRHLTEMITLQCVIRLIHGNGATP
ncbi:hypothetical protein [Pseudolysinimonas sp.]